MNTMAKGGKVSVKGLVQFFLNRGINIPELDPVKWREQHPKGIVYESFDLHFIHMTYSCTNSNSSVKINWWKIEGDIEHVYAELEIIDAPLIYSEEGLDRDGKRAEIKAELIKAGVDEMGAIGLVG